jgi:hypothetical protein
MILDSKTYFKSAVAFVIVLHIFFYYLGEVSVSIAMVGIGMQLVYVFLLHDFPIFVLTFPKIFLLAGNYTHHLSVSCLAIHFCPVHWCFSCFSSWFRACVQ